jgi:RNA polymerase sigma-70 factor (ECF subfamily)
MIVVSILLSAHRAHEERGASDDVLIRAAREGEDWALRALFDRYAEFVNGLAFRLLGDDSERDDLVQDSFLAAFRSLPRLRDPQAFVAWLSAIVTRTAHKRLRTRRLRRRLGLLPTSESTSVIDAIASDANSETRAQLAEIYAVLERLPAQARIALVLRRVEGMNIEEIAQLMGISIATVKRRLQRAEKAVSSWQKR